MDARARHEAHRFSRAGRNPFQIWVVVAATLTGVVALLPVGPERVGVVDRYLPDLVLPWYLGLTVGGLVTLIGTLPTSRTVRRAWTLLGVERFGLALLAGLLLGYGAAVEVVAPRGASGVIVVALGVASVARYRQAGHERHALQTLVTTLVEVDGRENPLSS